MSKADHSVDIQSKYTDLLAELKGLVAYIHETRRALGSMHRELPTASDALALVAQTTERATHNLLGLVEDLVDRDEVSRAALRAIEECSALPSGNEALETALEQLARAHDDRADKLTQMMTEMSFQDLTCQTIDRITKTVVEIETRVVALLASETAPVDPNAAATELEAHGAVDRLVEVQDGGGRQSMVDEILSGR